MKASGLLVTLRLALQTLRRAALRSALTSLGILIGIAAVVIVTALGTSAREQIDDKLEGLGSNLLFVWTQPATKSGARVAVAQALTDEDAATIRREAPAVAAVTVLSQVNAQVSSHYDSATTVVLGADADYFSVRNFEVDAGRVWTPFEEQSKSKVCLIGQTARRNLFGDLDPVGRAVRINGYAYRVIGTTAPKGSSAFEDEDDRVIMPISSWRSRVSPVFGNWVHLILANAASPEKVAAAERQIDAILRQRHRIAEGDEGDFRIATQKAFREQHDAILGALTALLVSVAAIALFVGGVGVMNIMLVSVAERTREIGLRMAIGAKRGDIQLQFLGEAVALTLLGGVGGALLAVGALAALGRALDWPLSFSFEALGVALGTSIVVGLVFGFLPARRASRLDPIEALRHE